MKMNVLRFLLVVCSLDLGLQETKAQSEYPLLYKLFEESDLIVHGRIVNKECIVKELGVHSCGFSIKVDSIFKGELSNDDYIKMRPDSPEGPAPISYQISFHHNCLTYLRKVNQPTPPDYFEDYCYEQGQYYIVFLQKKVRFNSEQNEGKAYYFTLTDQWLGVQPANSYMAIYLRQWAKD
jgi:hypothetical protein